MRNSQVTKFLILFVFVFLCSCDLFKSMCEAEKTPKQSTTLQQIVNDTNAGETIDLEKYSNEYDITDYNAEISKNLTIKNGSFQNTTLKIKAEVKLEKVQELSVETSANLTIRDSKLNNLLLGTNAESRSINSGNTNFDLKVIVKNCEIAEKIKINSKAKLNIAGEKTKIAKIVVAVAAEVCKILCTTEVDTKKIENVITDENGEKPEEIKITQAYKITYHSNCDELEDIEDFFSPDDGTISLPTDIFKRNGYIFTGWYKDDKDEETITTWDVSGETADINVYAGWTKYIPGSGVYKYSINIEDIPESGPWNGNRTSPAFSILLLTDKLVDASIKHGDFYFSNDAYQIQTRASENLRITDTSKTGNYAVYGEVPTNIDSIPENDKYKYYSGVAATVTDTTLEVFVDMSKIVKTELKVFRKSESSTAQEEFVTENTLIDLTDYKPYIIALGTKEASNNGLFTSLTWGADLMAMTAGATFPTDLQQSAPTTGNTIGNTNSVTVTDNNNNTETINFSELSTKLSTLSAGTYTLKVSGGITNTTITEIANAMNSNTEAKINLDLSETDGLTEIPKKSFQFCSNLISINIPKSVTIISSQSFEDSGLTSVMLPNNLQNIENHAFFKCSNLASIEIPDSVTTISTYAFYNCSSLTSVTFNNTNNWYYTNNENYTGGTAINVTDTAQNADNLKDTYSGYYWYRPTELTATADTVADTIRNLSAGTYMLKVSGEITSTTITTIATAMNSNTEAKINLDLSGANGLTEIPENAFCDKATYNGCTRLLSINIPDNVTTIGDYAFSDCSSLTRITIPNSVTSIGYSAFSCCLSLTSIEIPNSVTTIGSNAFYYCENLTSVTFNNTSGWYYTNNSDFTGGEEIVVTDPAQNAENLKDTYSGYYWYRPTELTATADNVESTITGLSTGTYTLKVTGAITNDTITTIATAMNNNTKAKINLDLSGTTELNEIPENAFYIDNTLNDNLISIIIPDIVTSIGEYAFRNCNITSVTIGSGVTSIGSGAFTICSKLKEVIIPNNIKIEEIKDHAFSNCYNLTGFTIPSCLASIGNGAFNYCSNLTKFEVDTSNPNYSSSDDGTILLNKDKTVLIAYPSAKDNVTIPSGVTSIADGAFQYCSNLTNVTIPDSVTSIGEYAFANCSSLTSIEIPDDVTSIDNFTFNDCSSLTNITIPNSVTSIGEHAFSGCEGLMSITIPDSVTSIGDYAFNSCLNLTDITISEKITTISNGMFRECGKLTNITIPDCVTSIGNLAFYYCSSLTNVTIPGNVTTIGYDAFCNCSGLTSVTFADTTSTWYYTESSDYTGVTVIDDVTDTAENATKLKENDKYWYKESSTGGTAN